MEALERAITANAIDGYGLRSQGEVGVLYIEVEYDTSAPAADAAGIRPAADTVGVIFRPHYVHVSLERIGDNVLPIPRSPRPTFFENVPKPLLALKPAFGVSQDRAFGTVLGGAFEADLFNLRDPARISTATDENQHLDVHAQGMKSVDESFYRVDAGFRYSQRLTGTLLQGFTLGADYDGVKEPLGTTEHMRNAGLLSGGVTLKLAPSLENSRKMKEKSHRAARRCYRSGSETFLRPNARRLDGYRLYTASHVWIRAQSEADRGRLRHAARQFGRRGGAAEESRYPVAGDEAFGGLRGGWAPAGQGAASDAGTGAATSVRARVWLCRLQRRRAAGRRCDPQAAGRPRSDRRAGLGLAADAVAVRERGRMGTVARHGARPGRHRDRDPAAAPQGPGHPDHDRPGSHRRPDPRLQRPLRYVVLPADRRDRDLQRRGRAVRRGRGAAAGQRARHAGGAGDPAALARQAARGLSQGHGPGAAGRRVCPPEAVHVPRAAAGRVRRGDGQQPAAGEAGPALDGQGPDAVQGHRPDGARVRRDAVCRTELEAQAAGDHQGRGRPPSRPRSEEQPPLRGDHPPRRSGGGLPLLLRAGGRGEPAQGTASRAGDGPDQLLGLLGQPVPGPPHAGGLHSVPGTPAPGRGHRLCRCAGHHAARAVAQARRVGRVLGPADRLAH